MLLAKIDRGENAYQKEKDAAGKRIPTDLNKAETALLNLIAAPDSIIIRAQEDAGPWLDPKHEQGFAIYEYIRRYNSGEEREKESIPEKYLMRQLLIFIRQHNVLPGYSFAQIKTEITENAAQQGGDLLEQEIGFGNNANLPFNIRYNTITAKNGDAGVTGTFSLNLLMAIVAVYLKQNNPEEIAEFISGWFSKHHDFSHRTVKDSVDKPIADRISTRCDFLIQKQNATEERLFNQIRFICQRINYAWFVHHGYAFGKDHYQQLENKVRYFNKEDLRQFLTDPIWTKDGVGLGRDNDKTLGKCITKDRLQDVYKDLSKAWCDYLQGVKEGLHKKQNEDLFKIAKELGCRLYSNKQNNPNMPVGLPPKVFKDYFNINKDFDFYRAINVLVKLEEPKNTLGENGSTKTLPKGKTVSSVIKQDRIARREYCRKRLLLAMATKNVMDIIDGQKIKNNFDDFKPLSEVPITLNSGNKKILLKFGKSWRKHAKHSNDTLENLVKYYLNDVKEVPLLSADEEETGQSIEAALIKCDRERLLFIQAVLQFEKEWIKDNPEAAKTIKRGDGGQINFNEFCNTALRATALPAIDGIATLRGDALHGKINHFSECQENFKILLCSVRKKTE